MKKSFYFYDLETTGLNPCVDQVLQFAGVRTTLDLNIDQEDECQIKLNVDTLPNPEAMLVHQMDINSMLTGLTEYTGILKIHQWINTPGTQSLGYNTLGFDDEFLRFAFYRYLLPPYTHQYANGCGRLDLYPMTILYYLYDHERLSWPELDGKPSFRLEELNKKNSLYDGPAHHAMTDVHVTIALAKRLYENRSMWDYLIGCFNKTEDQRRIAALAFSFQCEEHSYQEAIMVSGSLGFANHYQAYVLNIGTHQHYRNQTLWLSLNHHRFSEIEPGKLIDSAWIVRKRMGDLPVLLAPKDRFKNKISKEKQQIIDDNRRWLQEHPDTLGAIAEYYQNYCYPTYPERDSQSALYDLGFPSDAETRLYAQFHQATPGNKEDCIARFQDPIRQELGYRLMARHYPDHLSESHHIPWQHYRQQLQSNNPPIDFRGRSYPTPNSILNRIVELTSNDNLTYQQQHLLAELKHYVENDFKKEAIPG